MAQTAVRAAVKQAGTLARILLQARRSHSVKESWRGHLPDTALEDFSHERIV